MTRIYTGGFLHASKSGMRKPFGAIVPPRVARLVTQQHDLDYLTLDYLAEVSLSIMAAQREKDPEMGYARDFVDCVRSLIPLWKKGGKFKVVTNAGGLNPKGCAAACEKVLQEAGCSIKIGIVSGDDVLDQFKNSQTLSLLI